MLYWQGGVLAQVSLLPNRKGPRLCSHLGLAARGNNGAVSRFPGSKKLGSSGPTCEFAGRDVGGKPESLTTLIFSPTNGPFRKIFDVSRP